MSSRVPIEHVKILSTSSFGDVNLIKEPKTGYLFVLKLIETEIFSKNLFGVLTKDLIFLNPYLLRHEFVKEFRGKDDVGRTALLMEYCENGDLYRWVKKNYGFLPEKVIIDMLVQILEGVCFLHSNGIIHGDIKPTHILVNKYNEVKLGNFWISKKIGDETEDEKALTIMGTPAYMPPEIFLDGKKASPASDIYSVGCTAYFSMTKKFPFEVNERFMMQNVFSGKFAPISDGGYSETLKSLVYSMMALNPLQRPTIKALKEHPLLLPAFRALSPRHDVVLFPWPHLKSTGTDQKKGTVTRSCSSSSKESSPLNPPQQRPVDSPLSASSSSSPPSFPHPPQATASFSSFLPVPSSSSIPPVSSFSSPTSSSRSSSSSSSSPSTFSSSSTFPFPYEVSSFAPDVDGDIIGHFCMKDRIGKGGSGTIYLGQDKENGRVVVLKHIQTADDGSAQQKVLAAELRVGLVVSRGCHFLVYYEEVIATPSSLRNKYGTGFFFVMEYFEGGDLGKVILKKKSAKPKREYFSDKDIVRMVYQLGHGVQTLHKENIVHCDLKPPNIFLSKSGDCKIGDFSISHVANHVPTKTTSGGLSLGYVAPEFLDGDRSHTKDKDIYSLGIVIIEMIDLIHPFGDENVSFMQRRIFSGVPNDPRKDLSQTQKAIRDFALLMINGDPSKRPTIDKLCVLPEILSYTKG